MTQSGDPLENAIAERANGILKVEWLYKMRITTRDECRSVLDRIIDFYNTQRPHMSIGMQTPEAVHMQTGEQQDLLRQIEEHLQELSRLATAAGVSGEELCRMLRTLNEEEEI